MRKITNFCIGNLIEIATDDTCISWTKLSVASHFPDFLSAAEMGEIVDQLSQQPFETVQCLAYKLGFTRGEFTEKSQGRSIKDLLFFLLLEWKRRSPTNTKQSLALLLMSCGHYTEALRLDPTCMFWCMDYTLIFLQSRSHSMTCLCHIPYLLDQMPLSISCHSWIVTAPPDMLNESHCSRIVAAPLDVLNKIVAAFEY